MKIEEFKELNAKLDKVIEACTEMANNPPKPDATNEQVSRLNYIVSYLADSLKYMNAKIGYVNDNLNEHTDSASHLPPIKGVEQMQRALAALSLEKEYRTQPKLILASCGKSAKLVIE